MASWRRIQSPSSILTYKYGNGFRWGCPRKYYLRYIKGLKPKPKPALVIGGLVHKTIEDLAKGYRREMLDWGYGEVRKLALATLQENWDLKESELFAMCQDRSHCLRLLKDSEVMVVNWLHQFIRGVLAGKERAAIETKIVNARLGVQGIIDAVYNGGGLTEILDYKTSNFSEMTPDIKLQLAIYSLLYKEEFGKLPDRVSVHFLKFPHGEENPLGFKPTQDLIDYAAKEVELIHLLTQSDEESDYPCKCGGLCEEEFQC